MCVCRYVLVCVYVCVLICAGVCVYFKCWCVYMWCCVCVLMCVLAYHNTCHVPSSFIFTGSSLMQRGLGMRRPGSKAALHDPFEEGALVLYTPKELSAHEQLVVGKWVNVCMCCAACVVCVCVCVCCAACVCVCCAACVCVCVCAVLHVYVLCCLCWLVTHCTAFTQG